MQTETATSTSTNTGASGAPPPTQAQPPSATAGTTGQGEGQAGASLLGQSSDATTPPTDAKTQAATGATGEPPKGDAVPADFQLKLPEGFTPDEKALGEFKALASESGLKGEGAQKLLDLYGAQVKSLASSWATKQAEAAQVQSEAWAKELRADKEVGGANFDANLALARSGATRFCSQALLKYFNETGLGNHPELVKAFVKVGKAISEDSIRGASGAGAEGSEEARLKQLYPTMFPR